MVALFADLPEATANSVEIAMRCAYRPLTRKPILPRFTVARRRRRVDEAAELRAAGARRASRARLAAHGRGAGLHARRLSRSGSTSSSTSSSR